MEKPQIYEIPKYISAIHNANLVLHDMEEVFDLCQQPYHNNKQGCPNLGKKIGCPPNALHISQQYDLDCIHLLIMKFPFSQYIHTKQQDHPNWTLKALANPRHWQNHLKSELKIYWEQNKEQYPNYSVIKNPEGQGVNIQQTLQNYDIDLQWYTKDSKENIISLPENIYHVQLLAKEIDQKFKTQEKTVHN